MRLIDADALNFDIVAREDEYGMGLIDGAYWAQGKIDEAPTIDAVTVVRCKDCEYWDVGRCEGKENGLIREYTQPDDYCSYGKRREREKE